MVRELCVVLLQAFYLTLDSTTVIGVFLIMQYFTYFMCNPIASSLCDTEHVESSVDYNNKVVSIDNRVIIFAHAFIIALRCFVHILCM